MTFFSIFSIGIDINRLMIPGKNIKIKNLIDNLVIMFLYIFTKDNYFFPIYCQYLCIKGAFLK